ncbi:hypothetical protein JW992_09920 [candidate division KSB1 bacterium]|nr:hypothetical protein [candidate division KSB1 bacterium]
MKPLIYFSLFFLSCVNPFAPALERSAQNAFVLTEQQTPEAVLENFTYAYNLKDSLVYAELLDSSFVFVYFDPNLETSGRFVSWNRDTDLKTTGRLFRTFQTITLTWNHTIYSLRDESTAELSKTLNLNLFGDDGDFNLTGSAIFNFIKSPYDQKWRISRWKDESHM